MATSSSILSSSVYNTIFSSESATTGLMLSSSPGTTWQDYPTTLTDILPTSTIALDRFMTTDRKFCNVSFEVDDEEEYVLHDMAPRQILAVLILLIFVIGVFGNLMVIFAVILSKRLHTTTNVFVVNLAVADFLTSIVLPVHAAALLNQDICYFPDLLCKFVAAITLTTLVCSVVTLAQIAFHRFWVIYNVLRPKPLFGDVFSTRNITFMVVFSWLYPVLLMCIILPLRVGSLGYSRQYKVCVHNTKAGSGSDYLSLTAGLVVQVPAFVVIIVCYVWLVYLLRAHRKTMVATARYNGNEMDDEQGMANDTYVEDEFDGRAAKTSKDDPTTASTMASPSSPSKEDVQKNGNDQMGISESSPASPDTSSNPNQNASNSNGQAVSSFQPVTITTLERERQSATSKQQLKITLNLFIVVCVYTICVMPSAIALLIPTSDPAIPWLTVLLLFNSCVNPIIYAMKHPTFSQVFGCIIRCRFHDIQSPSNFLKSTYCHKRHYYV